MTRSLFTLLVAAVLVSVLVGAVHAQSFPSGLSPSAEIVGSCALVGVSGRPTAAKVSPRDSRIAFVAADGGFIADLGSGKLQKFPLSATPIAWIDTNILWQEGHVRSIVDPASFQPARWLTVEHVESPRGTHGTTAFDLAVQVPKFAAEGIDDPRLGGELVRIVEAPPAFRLCPDRGPTMLVPTDGTAGFDFAPATVEGFEAAPGGSRVVLWVGAHWEVANLVTRERTLLPGPCESWSWLPDGVTLVGREVMRGPQQGEEDAPVLDIRWHLLRVGDAASHPLELPAPLVAADLTLMDVTARGRLLMLQASREPSTPSTLHLLELRWTQAPVPARPTAGGP